MKITAQRLNRATLARQLLLGRQRAATGDAVRQVVALQAQHPASPYLALWNRLAGFEPASLDTAITGQQVVRSTLMRVTMHAVHTADYQAFREAMEPTLRASRLGDPRFKVCGLTLDEVDAMVPDLLAFTAQARTAAQCQAWLEQRLAAPVQPATWRMLRQYAPLWHVPGGHPWMFGTQPPYATARPRPVLADQDAADASLRILFRRYLEGFGPASVADFAQFAMVSRARAKLAVQALAGELEQLSGPDGVVLYDIQGVPCPAEDTPAPPRLMAMWDNVLLAYADRGRVIPPGYRKHVIRMNGDVLPALLVDGYVAGVWRPAGNGIEATSFHPLPAGTWDALAAEASALTRFLADREPGVYSRYGHWWARLPGDQTRILARYRELRARSPGWHPRLPVRSRRCPHQDSEGARRRLEAYVR